MAELADAHDLGSCAARLGGSSPFTRTNIINNMAGKTTAKKATIKKAIETPVEVAKNIIKGEISDLERTPDNSIELRIRIPWDRVKIEKTKVLEEMAKHTNVPGFRKGKAPAKLVSEKIDKAKVNDEVLRQLLPILYSEAVKEHGLKPVVDPSIHLDNELEDDKEWEVHAITCEFPAVDLGNYKAEVKKITSKGKIVVPGEPASPSQDGKTEEPKLDKIIKTTVECAEVKIPGILIQRESDRLISQMLEEIKKLGMTLDQYLKSTNKTPEDIREEYANKAHNDLKLEFTLAKVAEEEKITVEEADIQKAIEGAKPEEKESLEKNKYLLASILRQQKTLDFLKSL